ncbi:MULTISPECIES: NAD(P)-dependent oxidoreductase [unclassified Actinomyces]|uniref:NAD(P)-dependent oxidoreductase n=1 Tax=unclassified Actinomyces TaxID=2609248 RepID=UPI000D597CF7|nr:MULTISPECIES: NAD(P)-dependent oxidoreductase [unclassified Actinomyces]RAX23717.1 NAD(P)-dependent oxidoreductase [Actinomyces sp. Z3]
MTTTVAVLGLGAMGLPMATNLSQTFTVRGFDISAERLALAQQAGIVPATSAAEAVADADVVLVAVRNQAQLEELLFGQDGIAAAMRPGAAVLLTSTVGGAGVEAVAGRLRDMGLLLVDAPVSGGPVRAGDGDLLVVVGADDEAWAATEDVLEAMSSTLVRVGDEPGYGQSMKTVNQLLCGVHIAAAGEALALAQALGLDVEAALKALMAGAAESFMLGDRGPRMLQAYDEDGPEVRSRLDIFVKDMGIVTAAAKSVGLSTPVAAAAEQLYLQGARRGLGAQDDSTVITVIAPEQD